MFCYFSIHLNYKLITTIYIFVFACVLNGVFSYKFSFDWWQSPLLNEEENSIFKHLVVEAFSHVLWNPLIFFVFFILIPVLIPNPFISIHFIFKDFTPHSFIFTQLAFVSLFCNLFFHFHFIKVMFFLFVLLNFKLFFIYHCFNIIFVTVNLLFLFLKNEKFFFLLIKII